MSYSQILKRPVFANLGEAMDWEIKNGQVPYELPITLPEDAWRNLADAMSEVTHVIRVAKATLDHLHDLISQSVSGDFGVISILDLAARGLDHVSERECALLDDVEIVMRDALKRMIKEKAVRSNGERSA